MTICSLDIPLQVLIRPLFSVLNCKPVLQWLLISSPTSTLTDTYSVKYCHLLALKIRAFDREGPLVAQDDWGSKHMSKQVIWEVHKRNAKKL